MPKWTTEQRNAIDARNSDIIVSAAAGSGKTAVLVNRVIEKITDIKNNVDIDKLLIVTFTNSASLEMKSRIAKALLDVLKENPNDTNALKQLSLLPNARISTIDSFCSNIVRENFFMLDIQQDFTILDDSASLIIEDNAINKVIDDLYLNNETEFKALVELLSSAKNDKGFISAVKKINEYIMVQAFPYEWLDELADAYNPAISIEKSKWGKYLLSELSRSLDYIYRLISKSQNALTPDDDLFEPLSDIIKSDKMCFDRIRDAELWDEIIDAVNKVSFVTMTRKSSKLSAKNEIASNRELYKSVFLKDIQPLFTTTEAEFTADNEYLYPNVKLLAEIVKRYNSEMLEMKKELNAYKFSDIEHFAMQLLFYKDENGNIAKTQLAEEYTKGFDEILVDEYQDTNYAQDTLFEMLSNGSNRFMVGDVKQSIYRFRLAMPQIFTNKKNSFSPYPTEGSKKQCIILDKNFRSRRGICQFTNFVFSHLMTERVGELDYTELEYLNNGAEYEESEVPSAQLNVLTLPDEENQDEYEARQVAMLIIKKFASKEKIKDGDEYREIQYGDIAVLFRTASNRMPVFSRVFSEYGIPVISNNKLNLFESNEVSILVSLLRAIDNPTLDIPLLATLMSVFYGYTAEDIAKAKIKQKAHNLYGLIANDEAFSRFVSDLNQFKKYASSMSVESFLRRVISETSYLSIVSAMGNSEQRRLNVMKLIELAKSFDNGENVGLTAFLRYIDSIDKAGVSVESASVKHNSGDAVSLMTIHKSKGLEFPICIMVGTNHAYNTDDLKSLVQLNATHGIGLKVHNEEELYRYNSIQYNCIKNMNSVSSMSENLRVLYVALTRAKEQFIIFYTDKNPKKHISTLAKKITDNRIEPEIVKHISRDCDLLLLCALLHKDADCLREMAGVHILPDYSFDFSLEICFPDEVEDCELIEEEQCEADEETVKLISDKLNFEYAGMALSGFSSLRVASQLDEKDYGFKYLATSRPAFLDESGLTASERGTAMHEFMQYCDYINASESVESEINRLIEIRMLSSEQAQSLDRGRLNKLFSSELADRMKRADKIYKEFKVATFVPVSELEETNFTDEVLVQGIADCVFEENGELVLVDYKTDRVDNEKELLDRYKNQIAFYKNATEKTLKKPVKQALLYSFWLNKECIYK